MSGRPKRKHTPAPPLPLAEVQSALAELLSITARYEQNVRLKDADDWTRKHREEIDRGADLTTGDAEPAPERNTDSESARSWHVERRAAEFEHQRRKLRPFLESVRNLAAELRSGRADMPVMRVDETHLVRRSDLIAAEAKEALVAVVERLKREEDLGPLAAAISERLRAFGIAAPQEMMLKRLETLRSRAKNPRRPWVEASGGASGVIGNLFKNVELRSRNVDYARQAARERGLKTPLALHGAEAFVEIPRHGVVQHVLAALGLEPHEIRAAVDALYAAGAADKMKEPVKPPTSISTAPP